MYIFLIFRNLTATFNGYDICLCVRYGVIFFRGKIMLYTYMEV